MFCLGSDGAQQEGDDAEAARFAVAHGLRVKLLPDDTDVTHLKSIVKPTNPTTMRGSGSRMGANRNVFGDTVVELLAPLSAAERQARVLCHFSHAGGDDMADNTCHFGLNNFFADNGLEDDALPTRLYVPADAGQMRACMKAVFDQPGLRFIFSTRSKVPNLLDADGNDLHGEGYGFEQGVDEVVREGTAGTIVSYGDALYRALDAVERLRQNGIDVGLVNKASLNVVDETMLQKLGASPFVMVVESLNRHTALGIRFGTWLLERGHSPRYAHLGTYREGCGGLWEQFPHQGLHSDGIISHVRSLLG